MFVPLFFTSFCSHLRGLEAIWIIFFHHSISVTQFPSLNTQHSSLITYHLSLITLHSKYHTCLALLLNFHHSIFFTLFVGPIPVLVQLLFLFLFLFLFFLSTQITRTSERKKMNPKTQLYRQFQTMASFNFVCHSINKPRKKH